MRWLDLMQDLPQIPTQFNNAKNSALKQIASTRITRTNIFFNFLNLKKIGIDYDIREKIYHEIENLQLEDLTQFYHQEIKPISYNVAVMGKKENLDHSAIEKLRRFSRTEFRRNFWILKLKIL